MSIEGLSKEFSDTVGQLGNWVADYMTTVDSLQPVSANPEKHHEHLREIKVWLLGAILERILNRFHLSVRFVPSTNSTLLT